MKEKLKMNNLKGFNKMKRIFCFLIMFLLMILNINAQEEDQEFITEDEINDLRREIYRARAEKINYKVEVDVGTGGGLSGRYFTKKPGLDPPFSTGISASGNIGFIGIEQIPFPDLSHKIIVVSGDFGLRGLILFYGKEFPIAVQLSDKPVKSISVDGIICDWKNNFRKWHMFWS